MICERCEREGTQGFVWVRSKLTNCTVAWCAHRDACNRRARALITRTVEDNIDSVRIPVGDALAVVVRLSYYSPDEASLTWSVEADGDDGRPIDLG